MHGQGSNVKIALGVGNFDACTTESRIDLGVQLMHCVQPNVQIGQERPDGDIQATFTKVLKRNRRSGVLHNVGMTAYDVSEDATRFFGIASVGYANTYLDTIGCVGQGPVEQLAGDQIFVGDDQFLPIPIY